MNWLDIVILVVLALATVGGLTLGVIRAAAYLAGVIFGVVLAGKYYIPFSHLLDAVLQPDVAEVLAFIIILAAVLAAAFGLAILLRRAAEAIKMGWLDRLGGAVAGLLLGAIFVGAILALWIKFVGGGETIAESTLAPLLIGRWSMALALLPRDDAFDAVRSFFQAQ